MCVMCMKLDPSYYVYHILIASLFFSRHTVFFFPHRFLPNTPTSDKLLVFISSPFSPLWSPVAVFHTFLVSVSSSRCATNLRPSQGRQPTHFLAFDQSHHLLICRLVLSRHLLFLFIPPSSSSKDSPPSPSPFYNLLH